MTLKVKENKMVSPYFLFFLMHSTQTGIVVLFFQSDIIKGAGHDAWLPVLVLGLMMHLVFWMMVYILKNSSDGDVLSFHRNILGKYLGGVLNIILSIYFAMVSLYALHTYIDILQLWVFDGIPSWEFSLILTILIFYVVAGGFRIVTAIAFWGVIIPSFLLLSLFYIGDFLEVSYILPFMQYGMKDFLISAKESVPIYLGFETALVFFPFIKDGRKATKWGHVALLYTTFLYTIIAIITFMFYTQGKLEHLTWPTLTMIKIIQFSFLERFEFIFIFTWLLAVMPVICIYLWSAIRSIKITIPKLKPTYVLVSFLSVFYLINSRIIEIQYSHLLSELVNYSGLIFLFGYIPFLFLISVVRKRVKK